MKHKVNLFLVGAPKAGTTSIFFNLNQHDKIFFPKEKELHYFCKDIHRDSDAFHGKQLHFKVREEDQYSGFYKNVLEADVLGDASTSYLYSKDAAKNIYDYNPDAKILICLREPVSLMYSWYHYLYSRSDEVVDNFEEALNLQKERSTGSNIPTSCMAPIRLQYEYIASLTSQIIRYQKHFSKENIHYVVFESFVKDQQNVISEIFKFLKVDNIDTDNVKANTAKKVKALTLKRFIDSKLSWLKYSLNSLDTRSVDRLRSFYHKLVFKSEAYSPVDNQTESALKTKFLTEVKKLDKLCNINLLELWNYKGVSEE
jgi:hypothetical protein